MQDWISVSQDTGTTSSEIDEINVTVDRSGFDFGTHYGTINVISDGGNAEISVIVIKTGIITLISPNGGEEWTALTNQNILLQAFFAL